MQKLAFWLLIGISLIGCRSTQKVSYTPDQLLPAEKALLWKISANGLKKPSYLLGTIHLIPKQKFALSEATYDALAESRRVTFEIDMKEMTNLVSQFSLLPKAFMRNGKTLRDLLPEADYSFVKQKLESQGMAINMLERMKPLFLSTMFGSEEGSTMGNANMTSVEMELFKQVKRRKLETAGLETAAYQMGIFDSIPYEVQAKMLVETLRNSEGTDTEFDQMIEMYLQKDINGMEAMMGEGENGMDQYQNVLLDNRNRNWIPTMSRMMLEKPTLFAVGAGHLGGPVGVIALLRKEGYRVEAAE
ncbi:MAG: TraB/GumN family protein [Saprospiraceae bacterium]|nr:TraB/GumN family protein [Lewinellaceae bacterium]